MLKKINTRLWLGYSVPLIFLLGLGAAVLASVQKAIELENIVAKDEKIIKEVDEVAYDISKMVRSTRGAVLFPEEQQYREAYEVAYDLFEENAVILQKLVTDPDQKALVDDMVKQGEMIHEASEDVFQRLDSDREAAAKTKVATVQMEAVDEERILLLEAVEADLTQALEDFDRTERRLMAVTIFGTILALIGTVAAGLAVSIPLQRRLRSLIAQVQKSGIQVTTSTTEIAASGKQLEATVTEQVASTNEVNATSQEIATTAGELAKTMEDVAELSQSTAEATGSSQANLVQMEEAMRQLAQSTANISAKLGVMNEKANNINNVVTTITKVADQTNLLSLNAAIEAEKAGEYGAGFAVVAREIRRLADQTAVATLEIEQMVKEMQTSVSNGVMEVDRFNHEVNQSVDEMGGISTQIAQAIQDVQSLTPQFDAVSQRMENQFQGAEQISVAIAQLSEASQQTVESLQGTNEALTQLEDATHGLQREIAVVEEMV